MLTFDKLIQLVNKGIKAKIAKNDKSFFEGAFRDGKYLGCPGKDIYFTLPTLTMEHKNKLAAGLASQFPKKPPVDHVGFAACIRYIYGCFDKNGCLLSKEKEEELADSDWTEGFAFMGLVNDCFMNSKNDYGSTVHYEMRAHRHGDSAILKNDLQELETAIEYYEKSKTLAEKCKSKKHIFSSMFWAAGYLERFDQGRACEYYGKCISLMEKHCPDSREGYLSKAEKCIKYLSKHVGEKDWVLYKKRFKTYKNKVVALAAKKYCV